MATISNPTPADTGGFSRKEGEGGLGSRKLHEEGRVDAKIIDEQELAQVTTPLTDEEVKKAQDFLWPHIGAHNKRLLLLMATKDPPEKHGLEIEEILIGFRYKR